jgi:hypothetical protein
MGNTTKPKRESDQIRDFRKATREPGADENEERLKDALRKIAQKSDGTEQ